LHVTPSQKAKAGTGRAENVAPVRRVAGAAWADYRAHTSGAVNRIFDPTDAAVGRDKTNGMSVGINDHVSGCEG
jgi:hypothetical protein